MANLALSFIREFRLSDAPDAIVHQAKRCLLDLTGVAAAASELEISGIIGDAAHSQFGGNSACFLFDGRAASAAGAALYNATSIDGYDAHDGHPLTKGHAGCGAFAGLLALAGDGAMLGGSDALAHLIVGYEIGTRAGIALHATAADYHTSGAWVALGVAAIGARIRALGEGAAREALGIAEYNGPRSPMMRCIDHPAMIKDGSGWGAMAGVMAVEFARAGFTGAPAMTVEGDDVSGIWNDLGKCWRIGEQYFKPYPVCRWAQPAMEAAAQVQRDHAIDHAKIVGVAVRTFREASRLAVAVPENSEQAQYSLPFPLAALLVRGRVGVAEIDGVGLRDPAILRLSRATTLIEDAEYSARFPAERWARVEVELDDGRKLASSPSVARGSAENPMSDQEISDKYHESMEAAGLGRRATRIEEMIMSLESLPSLAPLVDELTLPAKPVSLSRAAQ